jgi:hypothetical protein
MSSIAKGLSFGGITRRTALALPPVMIAVLTFLSVEEARAWDGFGHMQIAEIAWTSLDAPLRTRVAELLKLNPQYGHWTAGVAANEQDHIAFVIAATWADYIKAIPAMWTMGREAAIVRRQGLKRDKISDMLIISGINIGTSSTALSLRTGRCLS